MIASSDCLLSIRITGNLLFLLYMADYNTACAPKAHQTNNFIIFYCYSQSIRISHKTKKLRFSLHCLLFLCFHAFWVEKLIKSRSSFFPQSGHHFCEAAGQWWLMPIVSGCLRTKHAKIKKSWHKIRIYDMILYVR